MKPMAERSYRRLLWGLALVGVTLDIGSKYAVFHWLYAEHRQADHREAAYEILPGVFRLHAAFTGKPDSGGRFLSPLRTWGLDVLPEVNHGALFGLGRQYIGLANGVFAGVSLLAAAAIAYWSTRRTTAGDRFLCAALGLILAGTLGNLYDRVVFNGVRDFLHFYWIEWPVFNVADCCLVCGAFLLLAQAFLSQSTSMASEPAEVALSRQPVEAK
jgi:signal peptidase II